MVHDLFFVWPKRRTNGRFPRFRKWTALFKKRRQRKMQKRREQEIRLMEELLKELKRDIGKK